jgi:hypothetical protein
MSYGFRPIVASSGRTGTTVMCNSIKKALKGQEYKLATTKQIQKTPRWNHVTKTHGYPPQQLSNQSRLLFLFGNPYDSVCSYVRIVRTLGESGEDFIKEAIRLTAKNNNVSIEDIFIKDIFQIEKRFDAFYRNHQYPVMTIKYETMWDFQAEIADFLEIPSFRLPNYRQRQSNFGFCTDEEHKQICETYKRIKEKIDRADDIKVWT